MRHLQNIKITVLFLILFFSLPAASSSPSSSTPLAEVNGTHITLGHVIAAVTRLPNEYENLEANYLLEGILDQLVKQELMAQALNASSALVEASLQNEIRSIKAKYALEKLMQGFPSDEMIQASYDEVTLQIKDAEEFNASHILVETEEAAVDMLEILENGMDFAELAREKSSGPSGPNGGQLGWFGLGQMVPEFEAAVMVLEIGNISQPVQTQFGWHIIKLNDRRLKPLPELEELKPEIIQNLSQSRIDELIKVKSEEASIKLFLEDVDPTSIRNLKLLE